LIQRIFSPVAGWLEHQLGLGQWRVAIECLNGHLAFYVAGVSFSIAGKGMKNGIFVDMLAAIAWLLIVEFVRRVAVRQAGSSMGSQTARLGEWHFRLILLVMLPLSMAAVKGLSGACYAVSLGLLIAHLYFKACDVPPPKRRTRLAFGRA
jgi:hypothetical protein